METLIGDSDWEDTMQDRGEGGNKRPRLCPKSNWKRECSETVGQKALTTELKRN